MPNLFDLFPECWNSKLVSLGSSKNLGRANFFCEKSQISELFSLFRLLLYIYFVYLHPIQIIAMKIIYPERIEEFADLHPDAKAALERWSAIVKAATWKHHADLKKDFPSVDYVGNNRYVFNIKGNNYRTVVLLVFFAGTVAIRFIGTHKEYDKIKDIKTI